MATTQTKGGTMKLETEATPQNAKLPTCKTTRQEMESLGWEFLCGQYYRHTETKENATLSHQGYASIAD